MEKIKSLMLDLSTKKIDDLIVKNQIGKLLYNSILRGEVLCKDFFLPNGVRINIQDCYKDSDNEFLGFFKIEIEAEVRSYQGVYFNEGEVYPCFCGRENPPFLQDQRDTIWVEIDSEGKKGRGYVLCQDCETPSKVWRDATPEELSAGIIQYLQDKISFLEEKVTQRNRMLRSLRK